MPSSVMDTLKTSGTQACLWEGHIHVCIQPAHTHACVQPWSGQECWGCERMLPGTHMPARHRMPRGGEGACVGAALSGWPVTSQGQHVCSQEPARASAITQQPQRVSLPEQATARWTLRLPPHRFRRRSSGHHRPTAAASDTTQGPDPHPDPFLMPIRWQ